MKILYTNFHTHYQGGHATYILNLYRALCSRHTVHIADPATSGLHKAALALSPEIIFAQDYPKKLGELFQICKSALQLRRLILKNQYDIIHVNGSPDLQLVLIACLGLKNKPALVYTKHNSLVVHRNIFSKAKFKRINQLILVCGCLSMSFEAIGIAKEKINVIKNGLDLTYFQPAHLSQTERMRRQLGLSPDDFVLVSSAGTSSYKRWECMVEAVSRIPDKKIKIVFIGNPPDAAERACWVTALGMIERVIFIGNVTDTRPYVAAGDMGFVLSDRIETVSFACREMMSMGLPMIVSDYACLPENVRLGENGWVVKTGDVDAIQQIVRWAYAHRDCLPQMGQAARRQALQEFGVSEFAEATEAVYKKALAAKHLGFISKND